MVSAVPQEDSSLLMPTPIDGALTGQGLNVGDANGNTTYGTFRQTARSLVPTTGTSTRSQTPTPSEGQDVITVSSKVFRIGRMLLTNTIISL